MPNGIREGLFIERPLANGEMPPTEDKLATAADWALAYDRVKNTVLRSGSMETLKPYAIDLVTCVDGASGPSGNDSLRVAQLAASCIVLLGW